jgi:hypothetical protein
MVLACVLFALVTIGIVVPCVIDAATSPPWAVRTLTRRDWLLIIVVCSVFGATAWLIAGRPRRVALAPRRYSAGSIGPEEAFRRHPAGRARYDTDYLDQAEDRPSRAPLGPDDDPEFLLEIERRIQESRGEDRLAPGGSRRPAR